MTYAKPETELKLVISIGANIPSKLGNPARTIAVIRPKIEKSIQEWNISFNSQKKQFKNFSKSLSFQWAPLFESNPIGGPTHQPNFINTVLVVDGEGFSSVKPSEKAAINLMRKFLDLEKFAGRKRNNTESYWGPRALDIDFISWGGLKVDSENLILPHPRFIDRNFVLIPLAEVLSKTQGKPRRLKPQDIWPE